MARARLGEEDAFALLIRRHQAPLLNFFRRLGAGSEVEDLVQDVFLRVYRYRDRYAPTARFTTFLYTLARHAWADHWRKLKRRQRIADRAEAEWPRQDDTAAGRLGRGIDAQEALGRLPEKLRIVLVLSLHQGFRYREIAVILGIPVGTVKSRVFLAVRRLKDMYDERR